MVPLRSAQRRRGRPGPPRGTAARAGPRPGAGGRRAGPAAAPPGAWEAHAAAAGLGMRVGARAGVAVCAFRGRKPGPKRPSFNRGGRGRQSRMNEPEDAPPLMNDEITCVRPGSARAGLGDIVAGRSADPPRPPDTPPVARALGSRRCGW